jgi:hypothetical protein
MMNTGYPVYREPSPAERREIDKRNGELAAALARSLRRLTTGVHHKMSRRNRGKTSKVPLVALTRSREVRDEAHGLPRHGSHRSEVAVIR